MENDRGIRRPNSRRNLDLALQRKCGVGASLVQARMAMACAIIGQLVPGAVVKGGTSLRLRYGRSNSRYTIDCDVARRLEIAEFANGVRTALNEGWNGFSGTLVEKQPAKPKGVPPEYVMQPFEVKLAYLGRSWCTVTLEVGFNEIGVADEAEMVVPADDIAELFTGLGFPAPSAIPLMPLTFQVAQKLHAVTQPGNDRARDLIDLQLMAENATMDFARLNAFCKRLFAFRKRQPWPSTVVKGPKWDELYDSQKGSLPDLPTVDGAIVWANQLIARINAAK